MSEFKSPSTLSLARVIIKGIILFIIINLAFGFLNPLPTLGKVSVYNHIIPGRLRLPFGEKPDQAYNLSLYNLDAMLTSHALTDPKKTQNEFRVVLVGDSSVWGYLLKPENTIAGFINSAGIKTSNGQLVHAYNLGYPTLSLTKDLLILNAVMAYEPDLIIWLVTLESFPVSKQLDSPIVQNNAPTVKQLISNYSLKLDTLDARFVVPSYWESTLVGQRRALADLIRLQLYGIMWASTGIDQYYPETYEHPQENLDADQSFHNLQPPQLYLSDLSFDVLSAGKTIAGSIPIIFINEPIYLSQGKNTDIRYNFFYPRWAYDQFRTMFAEQCRLNDWQCLDEWDLVVPERFTNSAIHMNPQGTQQLADEIESAIRSLPLP